MVPIPDSSYFPPLDKCLSGEQLLISWKSIFPAIQSSTNGTGATSPQPAIEQFLSDPAVRDLLTSPFDAFPPPTSQTKSAFETKTSAINVTPSSNARYDIKQIKDDALWLTKIANLGEVSALRLVVQEYQSRTSAKLSGPFSEDELSSIRESAGDSKFSSPIALSLLSRGADATDIVAEFETEDNRRSRILLIYLSERRYLLKCIERLLYAFFILELPASEYGKGKQVGTADTWLGDIGRALVKSIGPLETFALRCFEAIGNNVQNIGKGSGWYEEDGGRPDLEFEWVCTQIMEATHTMELIFQIVFFNTSLPSSQLVLGWFRLVQSCGFFDQFNMEEPTVQILILPLQTISMLVSLSVFGVGSTLDYLKDYNSGAVVSSDVSADAPFILNTQTILEIHQIMMNAADGGFVTAGPPLLAWVTILKTMKQRVWDHKTLQLEDGEPLSRYERGTSDGTDATLTSDQYEGVMEDIMDSSDEEDPIDFMARSSVNQNHVLETLTGLAMRLGNTSDAFFSNTTAAMMRVIILDLIATSNSGLGYIPEVVEALLSTLFGGQNYWDLVDLNPQSIISDPVAIFLGNEELVAAFLRNAMSRYPLESLPFLRMIRAVASCPSSYSEHGAKSALSFLDSIPFFTYRLPNDFADYETAQEEDNNNTVRLKVPVHLFDTRSKAIHQGAPSESLALTLADKDFCIPTGSYGRIISDSGPRVVFWFHEYSGLKYFGTLLETFLTASNLVDATTGLPADRDSVMEIIDILATIVLGISKSDIDAADARKDAMRILEIASSGLSRNRDIITVIFDIFEDELQRQSGFSSTEAPLGVLISCTHFIHSLISISPGRVWPHLARSALLGVSRGGGRLPSIVESVELVSGRYEFLSSCSRLYEALVEDIASNAMKRRSGPKSTGRFEDREDIGTGVPDQLLSKIMLFFTRYLIDILESSFSWKFAEENERRRLFRDIASTFDNILHYVYGIEPTPQPSKSPKTAFESVEPPSKIAKTASTTTNEITSKITGALIASASQLVDSFLATSTSSLRFQPLLIVYLDGVKTPDLTIFLNELGLWQSQVNAVLMFSTTLLRVSSFLQRPASQLEGQMFKAAPLVARLYAVTDAYKKTVLGLFEALIVTANDTSDPPSLLGHLGSHTAKNFVHTLSELDKPLARDDNVMAIWHFLATVVSNKQRWFANYLLTGKTPKEAIGIKSSSTDLSVLEKPLLATALETLSTIESIPKSRALGMLEFVALAQNFWPWAVYSSPKHSSFFGSILRFVAALKPIQQSARLEDQIDACLQTKIAACTAEIVAMHMFHSRQTGAETPLNNLIPNLDYFIRFAVLVPSLNSSLHTLLKRNFESRYPGCIPQDLKRTTLDERQLGSEYFYDLSLADKMLGLDEAWTGRRGNGLRVEFENANVNLSLVDAQIALFQGWKVLAVEISNNLSKQTEAQKALVKVSIDSLIANSKSQFSEEIFTRLCFQRADFSLILAQRLMEAKCTLPEMKGLLTRTWTTIRTFRGSFERPLRKEDAPYYRSLLKILFIAIRAHANTSEQESLNVSVRMTQSTTVVPVILDVIKYVVAMGMRECASSIHEDIAESSPEDIALITGILQSCLRIPEIELSQSQIVSTIIANDTARVATTLFSWSDSIAIDGDPIYGELSILFLLELSSMPLMAEQLAIEGVLGHIASANITSYLRRGNVGPFADGAGLQRCYNIWFRGILPFILNLLDAVQTSIAAEVAIFLNQFSPLLEQCARAFEAPELSRTASKTQPKYISLSMCSEAHSLALINYILNNFRENHPGTADIPELNWDASATLENVEFWLGAPLLLAEKIIPMGAREADLTKQKVDGAGGSARSRLEDSVVTEMMGIRDVLSGSDGS
ncbi:Uncharacterized protein BP5553_01211 [Venustampulla echinocandica]|uniref:Nucleoporin NUP188 n=1 Tax=Venustampulla echinocandica TaxID=2656787 RepID=A0A370U0B8_9HELO|nr:Uncharacterized protein BP5553_01211 [Venustampulla echinocandica]RDL41232.1 Uncharacterized protein BP5553_01211 [Venustampulla echinocandica]